MSTSRDSPMGPSVSVGSDVDEARRKVGSASGSGSAMEVEGEAESHLEGDPVEEERAGQKRKRYITVVEGGKKRKVVDIVRNRFFPPPYPSVDFVHSILSIPSCRLLLRPSNRLSLKVTLPSSYITYTFLTTTTLQKTGTRKESSHPTSNPTSHHSPSSPSSSTNTTSTFSASCLVCFHITSLL